MRPKKKQDNIEQILEKYMITGKKTGHLSKVIRLTIKHNKYNSAKKKDFQFVKIHQYKGL